MISQNFLNKTSKPIVVGGCSSRVLLTATDPQQTAWVLISAEIIVKHFDASKILILIDEIKIYQHFYLSGRYNGYIYIPS